MPNKTSWEVIVLSLRQNLAFHLVPVTEHIGRAHKQAWFDSRVRRHASVDYWLGRYPLKVQDGDRYPAEALILHRELLQTHTFLAKLTKGGLLDLSDTFTRETAHDLGDLFQRMLTLICDIKCARRFRAYEVILAPCVPARSNLIKAARKTVTSCLRLLSKIHFFHRGLLLGCSINGRVKEGKPEQRHRSIVHHAREDL